MKTWSALSSLLALLPLASATGCTSETAEAQPVEVGSKASALKLSECVEQRNGCLSDSIGYDRVACRVRYAECLVTAEDGVPQQLIDAARDTAECARGRWECGEEAGGRPVDQAICVEDEAQCVAAIVGVELPQVVEDTDACVNQAMSCLDSAEVPSDLASCGSELRECAIDVAKTVAPPALGDALGNVNECLNDLDSCVIAAETPPDVTSCSIDEGLCVAEGLGVPVPDDLPGVDLTKCATTAASCTLQARNFDSYDSCVRGFNRCVEGVVEEELTCEQRWTQCIADRPLAFPVCNLELLGCTD